ncbi:MAG: methionine synthase [Bacteroidales bacterium]
MDIRELLKQRVLLLDGAMGTMIQHCHLKEADFRGDKFSAIKADLNGNNDILAITRPDIIRKIHSTYLEAGADIIETDTFNATSVSMADYGMQQYVREINQTAARLAVEVAKSYSTSQKPRFVAGSIGPTNKSCSISPDLNDPSVRAVTYDELFAAYHEQICALIEGGVDILLIETVFDTLNAKCALDAAAEAFLSTGRVLPLMLSLTVADKGGRTLSGQTIEAFLVSVSHAPLLSVGINCSFGAEDILPFLRRLSSIAPYYISVHPNAGLPNRFGEYDETPEKMLADIKPYIDEKLVNIIGGCCGTTPEHIKLLSRLVVTAVPHIPVQEDDNLKLSGLEPLTVSSENNFINIGERCNVAGSRKFLRLINEKSYEEALLIARRQVEDGAQVIDVNMDDAMLDAHSEMTTFLNLIASEPEISRVPIMIDSSKWDVIEAGLKCVQGKSIVNSISLKEGEEQFLLHATKIKRLGAAVVVMAFDERGQADTFDRKIEVCSRAYTLLTKKIGICPENIIFDPNVLAVATGMDEHRTYALDFIRATRWIKENLPSAKVSGGVSNLSFSFRGNNYIREAMHAVFLYHAVNAGMDMGIVNPATALIYTDIPDDVLVAVEDVILNRREDATERLIDIAAHAKGESTETSFRQQFQDTTKTVGDRLTEALIKGVSDNLCKDIEEALQVYGSAVAVIEKPLMDGMSHVGKLFGEGKMFLPQVVKSARTMKRAVEILQPYIEAGKRVGDKNSSGKIIMATVKGDVHDIGKNIVSVVLSCNNYEVIDLGVMVPSETIINRAVEEDADIIGVSGLITPSLEEMCRIASELERRGLNIPLLIGGATTSEIHTAVKIAPLYSGVVAYVKDAAQNPVIVSQLLSSGLKDKYISELKLRQQNIRDNLVKPDLITLAEAEKKSPLVDWSAYHPVKPQKIGVPYYIEFSISELKDYINWISFFNLWKLGGKYASIAHIKGCDHCKASWLTSFTVEERPKATEAMQLHKDAIRLIDELIKAEDCIINTTVAFYPANSSGRDIVITSASENVVIPTLRQQQKKERADEAYYALSDFIAPQDDYIGTFAVTVGRGITERIDNAVKNGDNYRSLLLQSLSDRLAEAATALLHYQVRSELWGYVPNEDADAAKILRDEVIGIRPAIGYPSLPDQSLIFIMEKLLNFKHIGITITGNGAMSPASSITGFIIANPAAKYFIVKVDDDQRKMYIARRRFTNEEKDKWLAV